MDECLRGPREPPAKRWPACAGSSVRIAPHSPIIYLVSSADKSIGLRNRRSHVRIVHEVPMDSVRQQHASACRCRTQVPGRLRSAKTRRGNTLKARDPASPRAQRRKARGRSSKLTGPPPAAHRLPKGRCYPGRERKATNASSPASGESRREQGPANRKRVVPSGLAQPARHRISERVVRAVRVSQARAAHRSSGTWGGDTTRLAKTG